MNDSQENKGNVEKLEESKLSDVDKDGKPKSRIKEKLGSSKEKLGKFTAKVKVKAVESKEKAKLKLEKRKERKEIEGAEKEEKKKIEKELPYFMTFVTLLATSGFGPYTIFQKLKDLTLLPESRNESERILNRIDLLGQDPLTAMTKIKEKSPAREFAEFLGGYVSAIQGGGDVVSYLTSKMKSAFERYAEMEKQSIEKVATIVETYMIMQVVVLAVYIVMNSMSTTDSSELTQSGIGLSDLFVAMPPLISLLYMFIAKTMHKSKIKELEMKKIIMFGAPALLASVAIIFLGIIPKYDAIILGGALIVASIWPIIKFKKIYTLNLDATSASPSILRDIAETRKAGIGPEKCVIKACKRKDFGSFNEIANTIASRLEWGNSLNDI
ncbi:hypothetical protein LCGC14_1606050, partial [marine sediment metagenome]